MPCIIDMRYASTFCSLFEPKFPPISLQLALIESKKKGDFMQKYFV